MKPLDASFKKECAGASQAVRNHATRAVLILTVEGSQCSLSASQEAGIRGITARTDRSWQDMFIERRAALKKKIFHLSLVKRGPGK